MSKTKGKEGRFKVNGVTVAEMRSFTFTETAAKTDSSTLEDEWDTVETTTKSWSGSAEVWSDPTNTGGQGALAIGAKVPVFFYPYGTSAGKVVRSGIAHIDSADIKNTRDGLVEMSVKFTGDGELASSTVGA